MSAAGTVDLPSLTAARAAPAAPATPPPVAHPFGVRLAIGLVGVLIASLCSGLNDRVTSIGMPDLRGILGIGYDEATWLTAGYVAAEVAAMMTAPWLAVTFSFRRFAIGVTLCFAGLAAVIPFVHDYSLLLVLRVLHGLLGGSLPPLLMTAALRFLPPGVKLYGLSCYALTATFGPNVATSLAALWTDTVGWQWMYWQIIGPCLVAAVMLAYGLPQDPLRLERFKQFDGIGVLTGYGGVASLVLALEQGERLHWLHSPLICALLLAAAILLPLFLVNEWRHPLPLFKLQLLGRRNFLHGLLTLAGVLTLIMAGSALPAAYLMEVQGYRPLEIGPLALTIALPQLVICPLVATLCNIRRLDSRLLMGCGLALLGLSSFAGSFLNSVWIQENFYLLQAMQALGQPLAIVPLLMGATGVVQPMDGPFASAMFNTTRGLSTVIGGALVETLVTEREHLHSNVLLDHAGNTLMQLAPHGLDAATLAQLAGRVRGQALTMGVADVYLLLSGIAVLLIVLLVLLPQRAFPPQAPPKVAPNLPPNFSPASLPAAAPPQGTAPAMAKATPQAA